MLHAFLTLSAQWFDSMAFVVLGPQLAGALLPPDMPQLQQLRELFSIFALGHVLWLLGSFLWPAVSPKLGRRGVLAWTLGLSGFCTALVGCMPSYAEVRADVWVDSGRGWRPGPVLGFDCGGFVRRFSCLTPLTAATGCAVVAAGTRNQRAQA